MGAGYAVACVKAAASKLARLDDLLPAAGHCRAVATGRYAPRCGDYGRGSDPGTRTPGADEADGRASRTPAGCTRVGPCGGFRRSVVGVTQASPSVEDAIGLATQAHRGQRYRSPEAEPYIFHPLRVMLGFLDPIEQMAAVLHDTIEDTSLEINDLVEAGYPVEVVTAIECLTHHDGETYGHYIERVAMNDVARRVKIADLKENLANNRRSPAAPGNAERIERYEQALARLGDWP